MSFKDDIKVEGEQGTPKVNANEAVMNYAKEVFKQMEKIKEEMEKLEEEIGNIANGHIETNEDGQNYGANNLRGLLCDQAWNANRLGYIKSVYEEIRDEGGMQNYIVKNPESDITAKIKQAVGLQYALNKLQRNTYGNRSENARRN